MKFTVFGEILWDIFGEEKKIGGAAFNFAAHAGKLGYDVDFVSAVGADALGDEAVEASEALGIPTGNIQRVAQKTGYCQVTLREGMPSYDLVRGVAYDNIPVPENASMEGDVFYFGTLAQRAEASRKTLEAYLKGQYREVFFDINIRQNYYSAEMIDKSLKASTIFKVSREEIGVLGIPGTPEEICPVLAKRYPNLRIIVVTLDADGSLAYEVSSGKIFYSPKPHCQVVSTVGAGDSFSACFAANYIAGADMETCLRKATMLSSFVVTQLGACPDYPKELLADIRP